MAGASATSRRRIDPFCRIQLRRVKDERKQSVETTVMPVASVAGASLVAEPTKQQMLMFAPTSSSTDSISLVNMIAPPKGSSNKRWCFGGPALCFRDNICTICNRPVESDDQSLMNIRKGVIGCMSRRCSRVFHLECIRREGMLERGMNNGKWVCPRHRCANADKGMCAGDGKVLVSCADCTYALCSTCYQVSCDRNGVKAIVIHQEADDDDLVVDVTNEGMSLTSTTHQLPHSQYNRTQVHIVLDVAIVS